MRSSRINILCTGDVGDSFVDDVGSEGVHVDVLPFIEIKRKSSEEVRDLIKQNNGSRCWVFTSANAVKAVGENMDDTFHGRIYCIEDNTCKSVQQYFGEDSIEAAAANAAA